MHHFKQGLLAITMLAFVGCSEFDDSQPASATAPEVSGSKGGTLTANAATFSDFQTIVEQMALQLASSRTWLTTTVVDESIDGKPVGALDPSFDEDIFFGGRHFIMELVLLDDSKAAQLKNNISTEVYGVMIDPDVFFLRDADAINTYSVPVRMSDGSTTHIDVPDIDVPGEETNQLAWEATLASTPFPIFYVEPAEKLSPTLENTYRDDMIANHEEADACASAPLPLPYVTLRRIVFKHGRDRDRGDDEFELYLGHDGYELPSPGISVDPRIYSHTSHRFNGATRRDARPIGAPHVQYRDVNRGGNIYVMGEDVYLARLPFDRNCGGIRFISIEDDDVTGEHDYPTPNDQAWHWVRACDVRINFLTTPETWLIENTGRFWDDDDIYGESGVKHLTVVDLQNRVDVNGYYDTAWATNYSTDWLKDIDYKVGLNYW